MARMRLYPGAPKPPTSLGAEGCGVIESVGENITRFQRELNLVLTIQFIPK